MKITIQALGFTAREELLAFVREKVQKLYNLYDKIIECEIVLTLENSSDRQNKAAQIRLSVPGNDMLASAQSKAFEESAMLAIEGLERQIEKRKTQETTYS